MLDKLEKMNVIDEVELHIKTTNPNALRKIEEGITQIADETSLDAEMSLLRLRQAVEKTL